LTVNEKECERGRRLYVYFTVLIFLKFVIVCESTNIARISLKFGLRYQHYNVYVTTPIRLLLTTLQFATLNRMVFCLCSRLTTVFLCLSSDAVDYVCVCCLYSI